MMVYKSCPKCQGDLSVERDIYGGPPELVCLQCGYRVPEERRRELLHRRAHLVKHRPARVGVSR